MEARARHMMPFRAEMMVKTGLMCPPERGIVTRRKRKAIMNTAKGIRSLGSVSCESKQETMDVVNVNSSEAVATNSVSAAFHI